LLIFDCQLPIRTVGIATGTIGDRKSAIGNERGRV